ncbi:MAG: DUF4815 domain-containing protein [Armatimonadota bacterium]
MDSVDVAQGYKRIGFREDRDLLDTELNALQEIAIHERTVLMDRLFAPGSILAGLAGTVADDTVTLEDGTVYLDGHAVAVPGATLSVPDPGLHTIWLDVFRRVVTVAEDPTLVNPLTGEPTAEREKWIATLQMRDTTHDPWPEGAIGRTVAALYIFNRDTGELLPAVPRVVQPGDPAWLASHIGHGGAEQHPVVTPTDAGFMAPADKAKLDQLSPTVPPAHTHDERYYTETEVTTLLEGKAATEHGHPVATGQTAGFMAAADKLRLDSLLASVAYYACASTTNFGGQAWQTTSSAVDLTVDATTGRITVGKAGVYLVAFAASANADGERARLLRSGVECFSVYMDNAGGGATLLLPLSAGEHLQIVEGTGSGFLLTASLTILLLAPS